MQQVFQNLRPMLSELIGLIVSIAIISVGRAIGDLLKQNMSQKAYDSLSKIVQTCVRSAKQTIVIPAKDPGKPDLKWDEAAAESVKRQVRSLVQVAGAGAIQSLKNCGMKDDAVLTLIDQMIESHVLSEKSSDIASPLSGMITKLSEAMARPPEPPIAPSVPGEGSQN